MSSIQVPSRGFFTVAEVVKLLGCTRATLTNYRNKGLLKPISTGVNRAIGFTADSVLAFINGDAQIITGRTSK